MDIYVVVLRRARTPYMAYYYSPNPLMTIRPHQKQSGRKKKPQLEKTIVRRRPEEPIQEQKKRSISARTEEQRKLQPMGLKIQKSPIRKISTQRAPKFPPTTTPYRDHIVLLLEVVGGCELPVLPPHPTSTYPNHLSP